MTLRTLQDHVWRRVGPRKWIVGRQTIDSLVQLAVESWPVKALNRCANDEERQEVAREIVQSVKLLRSTELQNDPKTMGIIGALLLEAVVSKVIDLILEWWFQSASNRVFLVCWRKELTS